MFLKYTKRSNLWTEPDHVKHEPVMKCNMIKLIAYACSEGSDEHELVRSLHVVTAFAAQTRKTDTHINLALS